ncbi:gliding motility-associated C-terminal domain-containing protein [Flavobacterium sp. SUN052]|uniref:T9SS type B sorting domain-containing protein n=1 Tax=Flavobacterium sp. SUN052 TaxID=3002441 RepID=UPI00237E47F4|nr:gliding motility-associated C-terminal domain-containing protein [Flavobacterium sp. SUN052]MEC4003736.1 gliding motility-associated C-terminal domain-containing protein [Flavobacterium sp. SUN052]
MIKNIPNKRFLNTLFLVLFLILAFNKGFSQCPTVVNATQTFCNTQSPTVANLVATNNGNGVVWYATATSTTPLSTSAGLVNGEDYFADDSSGSCGARQVVVVTIYSAPTGQNFQGVCVDNPSQATIANLIANGNNIQWYLTPTGGTALSSSTVLNDNTIYYAGQTNPFTGCKTSRLSVFVNVGVVPVPTGNSNQVFCSTATPTLSDLVVSGGNNNWYSTVSSAVPLDPSTPLVNGQSYFATTIDPPCESTNRFEVVVSILSPNNSGTNGTISVCSNQISGNPTRNLFSSLGGTPDTTGIWTGPLPTSNGNLGTVNISTLTAAGSPYIFTYTVNNAGCPASSSTVTITISDPKNAGTNGNLTICSNGANQNLFTFLGGSPQSGGTWSPALASGTGVFNPSIDSSGTYTYTVSGPAPCGNASATVTVIITPKANAGTNGTLTICSNATPQNLFNSLGGTPQSGGVWSPTLASGTGVFNPAIDSAGTYTYTVTGTAPCLNSTATVTVTITPTVTPTFTAVAPICSGDTLAALPTTSNNGISGSWSPALNNTSTTTYTFTPSANQCANPTTLTITVNPKITPTFTAVTPICSGDTLAALPTTSNNGISGSWSPALNNTSTTTYTFTPSANQCANPTTLTITVNPKITPTFTAVTPICSGDTLAALPTTSNNGISGSWSPALNNTSTTTYTFTPSANQCANPTTLTITVNPKITPTFTAVTPICSGDTLAALPTTSNNGISGSWSPALNNTSTTTYTFTPSVNQCANPTTLTITVNPKITSTFTAVAPICSGDALAALPTTSNNGISGSWSPALNNTTTTTYTFTPSANQCANPTTLTITVNPKITPTFTAVTPICSGDALAALPTTSNNGISGSWSPALNNTSTTTYTFTPSANQCANSTTLTITVNPKITPTFTAVTPICSGDALAALPTTSNNGISGSWSPALNNTTTTTYTFTPSANQCANPTTLTITVNPKITPTFTAVTPICSGDTLAALPTTSNNGISGSWSPALNNTTTTTYTFTPSANQCANPTTLTITVNPKITPTFTAVTPICSGDALAALPTTSNNGISGSWSPALNNTTTTTYTFTPSANQCANPTTLTITVNPKITPTFTAVTPICSGDTLAALPTTSNNGISGSWSPALNNTATTTYTFTPSANQCANPTTLTIMVNPKITPTFTAVAPICSGDALAALPTTSNNGISGSWSPALNNTSTTTYTFTPSVNQCANPTTLTITVNPKITPTFTAVAPICSGDALAALPTTSNNGISGSWSPALNNTSTTTYTFTPSANQCANPTTLTITVNPKITPTFTAVAPICSGDALAALPTTSNNGINGSWSPALNNTTTTTYTFTPSANQCANPTTLTITVNPIITPTFTAVTPICSGDALAALPTTSNNGISGSWSPALNNTTTTTYTFTPSANQCANPTTLTITVNPKITPTFTTVAPICSGDVLVALPTTSNNGISGSWSPALNNTATTTYTFTPSANQCANPTTLTITVNPKITPTFTAVTPICSGDALAALPATSNNGISGSWSPALNNTATTTYSFTPSANQCANPTTLTIIVNPLPNAGSNGSLAICSNGTPQDLFTSLGGTPQTGGVWSPALASGTGVFNPSVDTAGVYTYTVTGAAPCGSIAANVTVSITPAPNAGTNGTVTLCANSPSQDLFTSLGGTPQTGGVWSPTLASGAGVFNPAVDAAGVYTYTVTGTSPCANGTASATVTVNPLPNAGSNGNLTICTNGTPQDLFTSLGGTPQTGGVWSPALASGTGVFNPSVDTAGVYTYIVTGAAPCGSIAANVTVSITPAPNAGTNGTVTLCANSPSQDLLTSLGGTPQTGGVWSPTLASGTGVFNPAVDAAGVYTYTVTGTSPCANGTASASVTVNPLPNAGSNGNLTICSNGTPQDLFTSLEGTPQTGGVWSPTLASGTGVFNPSVDTAGVYTYTVTGAAPCGSIAANVTVSITPAPNAGTNGTVTLCANSPSQDLFTSLGGTPQTGGVWSPALASGTGVFNPSVDASGVYTYTVTGTSPCANGTASASVTVNPLPNAGSNGSLAICTNGTPQDLFTSLEGTPQTGGVWSPALASGTGVFNPSVDAAGVYTYTVTGASPCGSTSANVTVSITPAPNAGTNGTVTLCANSPSQDLFTSLGGTPQTGGVWSPTLASGAGVFNPAVDAAGVYTYTVTGTSPCANGTASATVTVNPLPNAGSNGNLTICSNGTPQDLFTSLGGTPQTGGVWSPTLASGTGIFNPIVDVAGVYTYTVTGAAPCGITSATITVSITPAPNAGSNGTVTLCANSPSQDLFLSLGGTPQTGGVWSPTLASGTGVFNPAVDAVGVYTYTVTGTSPCANGTASATVTVNPLPNAGSNGNLTICSNGTPQDLLTSLGGTPQTGGVWSPALASGTGVFNPSVDAAGVYTYTVTGAAPCGSIAANVTVSITPAPNAGTNGTVTLCANSPSQDLFTSLGGTPQTGGVWSPALASGTGVFNPSVDAAGVYTYTVTGTSPCSNGTASATVTVNPLPNAGSNGSLAICSNGTPQDLFTSLGGTPQTGGVWSPALASGTGVFNPSVDAAGVYTYTVTGAAPCGSTSANVTVSITLAPNAGTNGTVTLCANSPSQDLFTSLGDTPQTGGVWSPALASGTGVFNPAVDAAGVYTYTVTSLCTSTSASVTLTINNCPITDIIIPDGFSPNGDGVNDEFVIENLVTLYPNFSLEIFNRYGSILYEGNINTPNWSGKSTEKLTIGDGLLPTGVYFFIINFNDGSKKPLQGRVYLSR